MVQNDQDIAGLLEAMQQLLDKRLSVTEGDVRTCCKRLNAFQDKLCDQFAWIQTSIAALHERLDELEGITPKKLSMKHNKTAVRNP